MSKNGASELKVEQRPQVSGPRALLGGLFNILFPKEYNKKGIKVFTTQWDIK